MLGPSLRMKKNEITPPPLVDAGTVLLCHAQKYETFAKLTDFCTFFYRCTALKFILS